MPRPSRLHFVLGALMLCAGSMLAERAAAIVTSNSATNINQFLGAETFYNAGYTGTRAIQANIEAGHVSNTHNGLLHATQRITGTGALGTVTSHATNVGGAMGGRHFSVEYPNNLEYQGIAYDATLWSGAIATSISGNNFNVTAASVASVYSTILDTGVGGQAAHVFNSSWGFTEPTGFNLLTAGVDGLINRTGAIGVFAAGNGAAGPNTVASPAAGNNSIAVAALGSDTSNPQFNTRSSFSLYGPNSFYHVLTEVTIPNARAVIDIAAPGQNLTLHNSTGPIAFINNGQGTSYAAPLVAGGASLIVDAGLDLYAGNHRAIDGRVVKAVLQNSADKTQGWTNGQTLQSGIVTTTQSLDYQVGAGRMNLDRAFDQYVTTNAGGRAGTTDVAGLTTGNLGSVAAVGWDFGQTAMHGSNFYYIDQHLEAGTLFNATLTWFADMDPGAAADFSGAAAQRYANLDLFIFQFDNLTDRTILSTVAQSISLYNLVEHLNFLLPSTGYYGIQVQHTGDLWNFINEDFEQYGLAWYSTASDLQPTVSTPEPSTLLLSLAGLSALLLARRKRQRQKV